MPTRRLSSIATRTGDDGTTRLLYGRRVPKDHPQVEAVGALDELNVALGVAKAARPDRAPTRRRPLERIPAGPRSRSWARFPAPRPTWPATRRRNSRKSATPSWPASTRLSRDHRGPQTEIRRLGDARRQPLLRRAGSSPRTTRAPRRAADGRPARRTGRNAAPGPAAGNILTACPTLALAARPRRSMGGLDRIFHRVGYFSKCGRGFMPRHFGSRYQSGHKRPPTFRTACHRPPLCV